MESEKIAEKVESFIEKDVVFEQEAKPSRDQALLETGIIDSTSILELVAFLEETFGITIEDEELLPANLDSIDKITSFVSRKLST
ncbi:MAG: acyl carrier protein [Candidatus Zixiibacteriota bacterium]|nr:MAG: acyl carrier protein [candidate division Zixibacteria bacterium]